MIIKDKTIGVDIDVLNEYCGMYSCYWPRASKESFMPNRGSRERAWVCLGKANNKCPDKPLLQE